MGEGFGRSAALGLLLLGVAAAQAFTSPARAQDWSMTSSIGESGTYNSNLLLQPHNGLSTFGAVTKPSLKIERDTPTSSVAFGAHFKFAQYFGNSDLNSDSELLNLNANQALSERSTIGLIADFDRDTTLGSEEDITGQVLDKQIRFTQYDVSPSWTYQLSPLDTITTSGSFLAKNYENNTQKTDYRYFGGDFEYAHQLNELSAITGSVSYFRYEADDPPVDTTNDVWGGLVGYKYAPSERFYLNGAVGMDYDVTKTDTPHTSNDDFGYRLKLELGYALTDQMNTKFLLSHDTEPSGDGTQVTRTRASLSLSYAVTELTTLALDANYTDNDDYLGEGHSSPNELTRYYALKPSLTWNITEALSLSASYQFRYKTFETQGTAIDNGALLTVRYGFPELHWSGF